jgi:hypothetical protein
VVNPADSADAAVAVIDLGSNTVLLLVLDRAGRVLCDESRTTRLGQGVFATMARAEAIGRTVAVEGSSRRRAGSHRILGSALRHCARQNAATLWIACRSRCGVRILPGPVEAALAIEASRRAAGADAREVVVIDVGGGSTEVAWTDPGGDVRGVSLPLGPSGSPRDRDAHRGARRVDRPGWRRGPDASARAASEAWRRAPDRRRGRDRDHAGGAIAPSGPTTQSGRRTRCRADSPADRPPGRARRAGAARAPEWSRGADVIVAASWRPTACSSSGRRTSRQRARRPHGGVRCSMARRLW